MFSMTLGRKLGTLAALGALSTLVVGGVGLSGLRTVGRTAVEVAVEHDAQRQQMVADMTHDAVRAEVVGVLMASLTHDARARDELLDDFHEDGPKLLVFYLFDWSST